MKNTIWILIVIAVLAGIIIFASSDKEPSMEKESENMAQEESVGAEISPEDGEMMQDDSVIENEIMMQGAGSYEAYAPEKLARAETGDVVLFFHADWCPTCRGLNNDINANLSSIPKNVSILKVNYDKETALKQKYGVTYQHTLVQVDAEGNQIVKWSKSPTLEDVLLNIK